MLQHINFSPTSVAAFSGAAIILYFLLQSTFDPLRDIPGPLLARFTRLWYFIEIYKGSFELTEIDLHKKYGPTVRIAPHEYSINDVAAAKTIYRLSNSFPKVSPAKKTIYYHLQEWAAQIVSSRLGTGHGCRQILRRPLCLQTSTPLARAPSVEILPQHSQRLR